MKCFNLDYENFEPPKSILSNLALVTSNCPVGIGTVHVQKIETQKSYSQKALNMFNIYWMFFHH